MLLFFLNAFQVTILIRPFSCSRYSVAACSPKLHFQVWLLEHFRAGIYSHISCHSFRTNTELQIQGPLNGLVLLHLWACSLSSAGNTRFPLTCTISICPYYCLCLEAPPHMTAGLRGPSHKLLDPTGSPTYSADTLSFPFSPMDYVILWGKTRHLVLQCIPGTCHRAGVPPKCLEANAVQVAEICRKFVSC